MPLNHDREKLLNSIVYFAKNTKHCGKTKLYKLLFYLDFTHFKETGRSVTGLEYYTWDFGPAPRDLHEDIKARAEDINSHVAIIVSADSFTEIKLKKKFDPKHFTKRELKILSELCDIFYEADAKDMVEASHMTNAPWDITKRNIGMSKAIDYFLALDDSPESITPEEAKERINDKTQLETAFQ